MHGSRFLALAAFRLLESFAIVHPLGALLIVVVLLSAVLTVLKRLFGYLDGNVVFFAIITSAIILIIGSSGFLLYTRGFHFGG